MTTADLSSWTTAASVPTAGRASVADLLTDGDTADQTYVGRHRRAGARSLSVLRMMYRPRHRAR